MSYWQVILGLSCAAALFVVWPLAGWWLRRDRASAAEERAAANARLYEEHIAELRKQQENGDITAEEFAVLQFEQQKALLQDVQGAGDATAPEHAKRDGAALLIAFAILTPLLGWVVYQHMGAKADWDIYQAVIDWRDGNRQGEEFETQLRHDLARRLEERPDNSQNWYLLATLAMNVQDYDQAVAALQQITELEPESAQVTAELAQALFLQAGNQITPEVRRHTQRALEIQPEMPTALGLAGIDAFQQGYFQRAIDYWSKAVQVLGVDAPGSQSLKSGIARAKAELAAGGKVADDPVADGEALTVNVKLGEGVNVDANATVFVYARASNGPPMPLAIQRFAAKELPRTVTLTESMAMAPGMSMSKFDELEVVARVSVSGNAVPQSGDWQATYGPVRLTAEGAEVSLTLSEQLP